MKKLKSIAIATLLLAAAFMTVPLCTVNAETPETLIWSEWVYSATGATVTSPVLEMGKMYRIVASEIFWYNQPANLAADAMYYTTDPSNHWDWGNHFPAPYGHSFLQINGASVNWGPFSNADTGHTYSITYTGRGRAISFRIVDWVDRKGCRPDYTNNYCHLPVSIYLIEGKGLTPGYWKNHISAWPSGYSTTQQLQSVFGDDAPATTLLGALRLGGGWSFDYAKQILARAATAALLNAATFGDAYPYSVEELIDLVSYQFSHGTRYSVLSLATELDNYNNLGDS